MPEDCCAQHCSASSILGLLLMNATSEQAMHDLPSMKHPEDRLNIVAQVTSYAVDYVTLCTNGSGHISRVV
jgi:hypothetical protein